jgi:hypothetical protein
VVRVGGCGDREDGGGSGVGGVRMEDAVVVLWGLLWLWLWWSVEPRGRAPNESEVMALTQ